MKVALKPRPAIYPCPVLVVGSQDAAGNPNLMAASWGGLTAIMPPSLMVSIRPETRTHSNIMETGAFTVAIPRASQAELVDMLGTTTGAKVDKFALAGLTLRAGRVAAPYADEFPLVMECQVAGTADLGSHTMFIGKIVGLLADEDMTDGKSLPELAAIDPLTLSPAGYAYHGMHGQAIGNAFRMGKKPKDRLTRLDRVLVALGILALALMSAFAVGPSLGKAMETVGHAISAGGRTTP